MLLSRSVQVEKVGKYQEINSDKSQWYEDSTGVEFCYKSWPLLRNQRCCFPLVDNAMQHTSMLSMLIFFFLRLKRIWRCAFHLFSAPVRYKMTAFSPRRGKSLFPGFNFHSKQFILYTCEKYTYVILCTTWNYRGIRIVFYHQHLRCRLELCSYIQNFLWLWLNSQQ